MPSLTVLGLASGKSYGPWLAPTPDRMLMDFLREQGIPIASSCAGEGICRKCVVNANQLSCQTTVQGFLSTHPSGVVQVDYL